MAEAIAAFGLAANVIQFIEFGSKLTSSFWQLYKSSRDGVEEVSFAPHLQTMTSDLQSIVDGLVDPESGDRSDDESGLCKLAKGCQVQAVELQNLLSSLCVAGSGKYGKREALKAAFKAVWKENEIKSFETRLGQFRQQLSVHLLSSLR
jgi:hypothetical protein